MLKEVVGFIQDKLEPASKRAYKNTKYDFHAGYNKACKDFLRRIKNK